MQCRQALSGAPEQKIERCLSEPPTQCNLRSLFSTSPCAKLQLFVMNGMQQACSTGYVSFTDGTKVHLRIIAKPRRHRFPRLLGGQAIPWTTPAPLARRVLL